MKSKQNAFSNHCDEKRTVFGRFKVVLMGKDFQPMPSYWALIPVSQDNILRLKKKDR